MKIIIILSCRGALFSLCHKRYIFSFRGPISRYKGRPRDTSNPLARTHTRLYCISLAPPSVPPPLLHSLYSFALSIKTVLLVDIRESAYIRIRKGKNIKCSLSLLPEREDKTADAMATANFPPPSPLCDVHPLPSSWGFENNSVNCAHATPSNETFSRFWVSVKTEKPPPALTFES